MPNNTHQLLSCESQWVYIVTKFRFRGSTVSWTLVKTKESKNLPITIMYLMLPASQNTDNG